LKLSKQIQLILLTPALLTLGWPPLPTGILLLAGFVPLLFLQNEPVKYIGLKTYLSLLLWNIGCTWWVWNASAGGAIAMLIANSLLMSGTFYIYRRVKKNWGNSIGLIAWGISWLAMEYLHLNWEIAFPWLNLGNGLAGLPEIIQWYEFTGALGGSLWIIAANAFLFLFLVYRTKSAGVYLGVVLFVPIIASIISASLYKTESHTPTNIVVMQPNVDPYLKFTNENHEEEVSHFIKQAQPAINAKTDFLLFPETALTENCEENYIQQSTTYRILGSWLKDLPHLTLVSGCNTYRFMDKTHKTPSARKFDEQRYYDVFNASLVMNSKGIQEIYRKSKLVPGVEKMPYPKIFGFLEYFAIDLGGISGTLGEDSIQRVFKDQKNIGAAPLICYESIFGEHASRFVNKGAQIIFVLTNDGWWGNTPGYRQHKLYARLRAIENRRYVVRCTNTGTSCMISPTGQITGETPWWEPATVTYKPIPQNQLTFYTRNGDYIGLIAACLFGIVITMSIGGKSLVNRIFP
jgi:apolipoprotein N-acyltransferase